MAAALIAGSKGLASGVDVWMVATRATAADTIVDSTASVPSSPARCFIDDVLRTAFTAANREAGVSFGCQARLSHSKRPARALVRRIPKTLGGPAISSGRRRDISWWQREMPRPCTTAHGAPGGMLLLSALSRSLVQA